MPPDANAIPTFPMAKNNHPDYSFEGWSLVRNITAIESAIELHPGFMAVGSRMANAYQTNGAVLVGLRLFANVSAADPVIRVVCDTHDGPSLAPEVDGQPRVLSASKGRHIIVGTMTFSGSTTTAHHPVTGAASATTYYELSAYSSTFTASDAVKEVPSSAATSYEKIFTIDCGVLKAKSIYVYATSMGGTAASSILVACSRIQ